MVGLGRGVVADGALAEDDQQRALGALARFRILTRQMGARRVRAVATAAVRDASNGAAFLAKVRELGFAPEILPGDRAGFMAGPDRKSVVKGKSVSVVFNLVGRRVN